MSALPLMLLFLSAVALTFQSCKGKSKSNNLSAATDSLSDDALMDTVQRRTFLYFWEGAEPNSGLAPERYHVDGVYPENDANVVTSGGSGFGKTVSELKCSVADDTKIIGGWLLNGKHTVKELTDKINALGI